MFAASGEHSGRLQWRCTSTRQNFIINAAMRAVWRFLHHTCCNFCQRAITPQWYSCMIMHHVKFLQGVNGNLDWSPNSPDSDSAEKCMFSDMSIFLRLSFYNLLAIKDDPVNLPYPAVQGPASPFSSRTKWFCSFVYHGEGMMLIINCYFWNQSWNQG